MGAYDKRINHILSSAISSGGGGGGGSTNRALEKLPGALAAAHSGLDPQKGFVTQAGLVPSDPCRVQCLSADSPFLFHAGTWQSAGTTVSIVSTVSPGRD